MQPSPKPTPPQCQFLRHLVVTGRPWMVTAGGQFRLDNGVAVRFETVRCAAAEGWLLVLGELGVAGARGLITPAGRLALAAGGLGPAGWDDEDRVRLREPDMRGRPVSERCRGPLEVEECGFHPGQLEVYRVTWARPRDATMHAHLAEIEDATFECVQACPQCCEVPALEQIEARP